MQNTCNGKVVNINSVSAEENNVSKPKSLEVVNPMGRVVGISSKLNLDKVKIIKKDGTLEDYDIQKVVSAIKKSAARMLVDFTDREIEDICNYVNMSVLETQQNEIEIFKMHCIVENALENINPKVAKSYRNYRDYKIGYTGWFANANSQSIILISMAPFIIYYAIKKKNKIGIIFSMLTVTLVLLSNGTTAGYLSVFVIFAGFAVFFTFDLLIKKGRKCKGNLAMIAACLAVIVLSGVIYPYTPKYAMDTYDTYKREEENVKIAEKQKEIIKEDDTLTLEEILSDPKMKQDLIDMYEDELNPKLVAKYGAERVLEQYGWMPDSYTLADVRMQKRINAKLVWEDSNLLTKFFGIEFTEMEDYDLENDYPAIFYYYGYVGFGLYIIFLAYFIFLIIKTVVINFKNSFFFFNFALAITYVLQLGLAQFSGAILRRPNASIYMSLIIGLIYYQCMNASKQNITKKENEICEPVLKED